MPARIFVAAALLAGMLAAAPPASGADLAFPVVKQTPGLYGQIADLLANVNRWQDQQVALEVRIVTVPDGFVEPHANVQFLDQKQLYSLLEAAQGDTRTIVTQAPKMTVFCGQAGTLSIPDGEHFVTGVEISCTDGGTVFQPKLDPKQCGLRLTTLPVISADRRFVQLRCNLEHTTLAALPVPTMPIVIPVDGAKGSCAPVTQLIQRPSFNVQQVETTATVPDGGTVLFSGLKKTVDVRTECCTPVLGNVPYMNRLFRTVGVRRETQHVLVLVTPRIIIMEEEEDLQAGHHEPACKVCRGACEAQTAEACLRREAAPMREAHVVSELLQAYDAACAEGHPGEAKRYADAALAIDPTCFRRK